MTHDQAKELLAATDIAAAAAAGDLDKLRALFDSKPEIVEALNALTPKPGEETPQRLAARMRKLPVLELFIERGVTPDLFMHAALGHVEQVEAHLQAHPKDVTAAGANGVQLMSHANHPAMVELLITRGIDPTAALQQLSWAGRAELMAVALTRGAKVNEPAVGRRPIHIAAARGHKDAVALLLQHGADVHARSKGAEWEGKTALGLALMGPHPEVVALLRQHIATVAPPPKPPAPVRRPFTGGPPRRRFRR